MAERFQRREGDTWIVAAWAAFLRSTWARQALAALGVGAILTAGFMRFVVLDRVVAQEVRIDLLSERIDSNSSQLRRLRNETSGTFKLTCLRSTRVEQQLAESACPSDLFLGVPR